MNAHKQSQWRLVELDPVRAGGKRYGSTDQAPTPPTTAAASDKQKLALADIIGSFGPFQFLVLLFSGLREGVVGYDALIMSVLLRPVAGFLCADRLIEETLFESSSLTNESSSTMYTGGHLRTGRLWGLLHTPASPIQVNLSGLPTECFSTHGTDTVTLDSCQTWLFPQTNKAKSLVAHWSLVCQHDWLVACIESVYFFGLMLGSLFWGHLADQIGRRRAYLIAHGLAASAGCLSTLVDSVELFAILRFLSAFGAISYNIIYSIQIELISTKHRAFSTILNHLGWGLGVICVPLADWLFDGRYRYMIALAPLLTVLMFPWAFWLPESSRWLLAHGKNDLARQELIRAANMNGKPISEQLEKDIALLEQQIAQEVQQQQQESGKQKPTNSFRMILSKATLRRDTIVLAYTAFMAHLFYYMLTINFAYIKSLSVEANFIISGAGDWFSVAVGAMLLKVCSRKFVMSLCYFLIGLSFLVQFVLDRGLLSDYWLDTPLLATANNGLGTLSSLLLIFVVFIVAQEVFPTVIRQTGSSIVNTLGECGSTMAPIAIQLSRSIGNWQLDLFFMSASLLGLAGVQFVTKTDDIELPDI